MSRKIQTIGGFFTILMGMALLGCQSDGKARTIELLQEDGLNESAAISLANNKPALRQYVLNRSMASQDDAYCRSLGARVGSDAYVQCRTSVSANRPVNDPPSKPRQLSCTSRVVFGTLKTTCD